MMRFGRFMMRRLGDLMLSLAIAATASGLVATAFWSGDAFVSKPWLVAGVSLVALLFLNVASYNKVTLAFGVVGIPLLAAMVLFAAAQSWTGEGMFADQVGNPCPPLLSTMVTTTVVYLLLRRRGGTVVLLALCVTLVGYLQFVYAEHHVIMSVALLLFCVVAIAFRMYIQSCEDASWELRGALTALGSSLLSVAVVTTVCCGLYVAVIAPLDPPTLEVKMIKEYLALPQVDLTGVANDTPVENEDQTTKNPSEDEGRSSGQASPDDLDEGDAGFGAHELAEQGASLDDLDADAQDSEYRPQTHTMPPLSQILLWLLLALLVVGIVVGAVRGKVWLRNRRLQRMLQQPPSQQVTQAYLFALEGFAKLKVPGPRGQTPLEYAASITPFIEEFSQVGGADFTSLTHAYAAVAYGNAEPTDAQIEGVRMFLEGFYEGCRRQLGKFKYVLKFFFL